jgi:hypothetical protein
MKLRPIGVAALPVVAVATSAIWLPLTVALAVWAFVALLGVVWFRKPVWRNASLFLAATLFGLAGLEFAFWIIDPQPTNSGTVKLDTPGHWLIDDDVVSFKLKPGIVVDSMSKFGDQILYHKKYTIDAAGARETPGSVSNGPTYLFIGDSLIFSQGLGDAEAMASQFAQSLRPPAHVVNLGVPGYALNNLIRAVETGQYDPFVIGKVKAVVTWIAHYHMDRVTGDQPWLAQSPRYALESDGRVRYTGDFLGYRLSHPLDGTYYVARHNFRSIARASHASMQRKQATLFVALLARLRDLVKERYGAPLVLIIDWPERVEPGANDNDYAPVYQSIAALGMPMVSVRQIIGSYQNWSEYLIPHDGHPNARLAKLVAQSLRKTLDQVTSVSRQ